MIVEIAEINIKAGQEQQFESAVAEAAALFRAAKGCRGLRLQRGIERPGCYQLVVHWETLEDHTVGFRSSAAFGKWRELAGPHFASAPQVQHVQTVLDNDWR